MQVDWPMLAAFVIWFCLVALSDAVRLSVAGRNAFGLVLAVAFVTLGALLLRERA